MKKLLFIISLVAIMVLLCTVISAEEVAPVTETYYLVQSYNSAAASSLQAEGKSIVVIDDLFTTNGSTMGAFFNGVKDGDHIEIILAETIYTERNAGAGILINRAITVTVKYNGFTHVAADSNNKSGFFLTNKNSLLRLIGSKGADENGNVSTEFEAPTFITGQIITTGNVDAYHGYHYVHVDDGSVYMENMRTYTGEAGLASSEGSSSDYNDRYTLVNCALSSKGCALNLSGGGRSRKVIKIENCYIDTKINTYTVTNGSYVRNSVINGTLLMDCWDVSGQIFEFENTTILGSIITYTGRTRFIFTNCTFDPSLLSLGSDGGGGCSLQAITTATCDAPGSKIVYGVKDKVGKVDNSYASENPALGHTANIDDESGVEYESFLEGGIIAKCVNCGMVMTDENIKAEPLFTFLGYSTPEDGSYGIVASFIVNVKAIEQYELKTGKSLTYGIVAGAKSKLGDNNPLDNNGNAIVVENGSVVKADISREYASYDFLLTGMNENQLGVELVIATYVKVTKNDEASVVYLQETQKTENLSVISYNTIPKGEI